MSWFDAVLGIPLLYAAYRGFRDGVIIQLGGILALILGIFLAFKFGEPLGEALGIGETFARIVGFIIIILAVLLCLAIVGRAVRGLFRFAGLGLLDQIGGLLLSVVKMGIILCILLMAFEALNRQKRWVSEEVAEKSVLYKPVRDVADILFPYVDLIKAKWME